MSRVQLGKRNESFLQSSTLFIMQLKLRVVEKANFIQSTQIEWNANNLVHCQQSWFVPVLRESLLSLEYSLHLHFPPKHFRFISADDCLSDSACPELTSFNRFRISSLIRTDTLLSTAVNQISHSFIVFRWIRLTSDQIKRWQFNWIVKKSNAQLSFSRVNWTFNTSEKKEPPQLNYASFPTNGKRIN